MKNSENNVKKLIAAGSDIAGAAAGGALGFMAGGPAFVAGASVFGFVVTKVLQDVSARFLSTNEMQRIGATAAIAITQIQERITNGENPRTDDFFDKKEQRSSAEEIFEGTLIAAKNTHEDKKTIYIGNLFANICFESSCSNDEANYHLSVAQSLTYAQFCLLQIFSNRDNLFNLNSEYIEAASASYATVAHLQSIHRLIYLGIAVEQVPGEDNYVFVMDIHNIRPDCVKLSVIGERLHKLLGLSKIPVNDLREVAKSLT